MRAMQSFFKLTAEKARARELELPACKRKVGCIKQGWVTYTVFASKLRKLGLLGKPWIYVGLGFAEVCCLDHDTGNFKADRKFRIKDVDALLAYDTELRLGLGVKR